MKKTLLFVLLYFSTICIFATGTNQDLKKSPASCDDRSQVTAGVVLSPKSLTSDQIEHLSVLCKVWGFVKYHHPEVASWTIDMDEELVKLIQNIKAAGNKEVRNNALLSWIKSFWEITDFMPDNNFPNSENIKLMPDHSWIDKNVLGDALVVQLENIKKAVKPNENPYIDFYPGVSNPDFSGEEPYSEMQYPNEEYRLLALFRYWNMIQYYFPNRHLIDDNWHEVLKEFIPRFISAKDEYEYKYSVLMLWAKIKDSHAFIAKKDDVLYKIIGYRKHKAPLDICFIENKAVIRGYLGGELGEKTGLLPGDVIEMADGVRIEDIVEERSPVTSASNNPALLRGIAYYLLMSDNAQMELQYRRKDEVKKIIVNCYDPQKLWLPRTEPVQTIESDIAYIYPGTIKSSDYSSRKINDILNKRGMIIDLRCYPNTFMVFNFGKYLMPEPTPFVKLTNTNYSYPGLFTYREGDDVGEVNPDYFKGKIVIIVNEETQSQGEYTTMAFRVAPNTTVIGSITAGADGNVSKIVLPGDLQTYISGIGVYYPDGTETQRVGIVPDIEVKPTIEGIRNGIDEPLQKAIEIINNESFIGRDIVNNEILLYPNPTTARFYLKGISNPVKISITDMQGRTMLVQNIIGTYDHVNIESLSKGTYIVIVEFADKIVKTKITKM